MFHCYSQSWTHMLRCGCDSEQSKKRRASSPGDLQRIGSRIHCTVYPKNRKLVKLVLGGKVTGTSFWHYCIAYSNMVYVYMHAFYMAEILLIRRKTLSNQSTNRVFFFENSYRKCMC